MRNFFYRYVKNPVDAEWLYTLAVISILFLSELVIVTRVLRFN